MSELREGGWDNGDNYNRLNEMMRDVDELLDMNIARG